MSSDPLLERLRAANPHPVPTRTDEQLWASIVAGPGDPRLTKGARPAAPRSRRHPLLLTGGILTALLAVVGVIAALVLAPGGATSPPPAFAVTRSQNRVTITLRQITGITGLNAKLASMGIRIRAVPVVRGCVAPVRVIGPDHRPGPAQTLEAATGGGSLIRLTVIPPSDPGRTFVLAASKSGIEFAGQMVQGPAPACVRYTPPGKNPFMIPAQ